jgi:hypothetical protein
VIHDDVHPRDALRVEMDQMRQETR